MSEKYYVYIVGNARPTLYIGVTKNLPKRMDEHQKGLVEGFTSHYKLTKLLYLEEHKLFIDALARERQLKHWNRQWKLELIQKHNPSLQDLTGTL